MLWLVQVMLLLHRVRLLGPDHRGGRRLEGPGGLGVMAMDGAVVGAVVRRTQTWRPRTTVRLAKWQTDAATPATVMTTRILVDRMCTRSDNYDVHIAISTTMASASARRLSVTAVVRRGTR